MGADKRLIVKVDTETGCDLQIADVGRHRYLSHPSSHLIMFGYKLGSGQTELWKPGMPVPYPFKYPSKFRFAAFNAQFDWLVFRRFMKTYGFGRLELDQFIDVMAVAARFGLPQGLDKLGAMLRVEMVKMSEGKALVKAICTPPYDYTPEQMRQFEEYCKRDVDSMSEIMDALPSPCLSDAEQAIWLETAIANNKGLPVDAWSVKQIWKVVQFYIGTQQKRVPFITKKEINTIGQIQKIVKFCNDHGVKIDNLQKQTVQKAIEEIEHLMEECAIEGQMERCDELQRVHELLRIRQLIGGAAVKKYKRLLNMSLNNVIYDNLRYHGAGTGRTTGGGFQMLNLPRAKIKPKEGQTYTEAVESVLTTFFDVSVLKHPDPLEQAKKLVRPMIKAPKGKTLCVADWGSIEYILLMWFCGEYDKVEKFKNGNDPYIDFATELFHVPYNAVTDEQRQESKPPVLGSGYMLGWRGLIEYALGYGVAMTEEQAQFATNTYRDNHPMVVQTWYALKNAAHSAIQNFGVTFNVRDASFTADYDRTGRPWLIFQLPSGRKLYYCQPKLIRGKYGLEIEHMGVHPETKQWTKVSLRPQRIIENCIQGLGRDILQECTPKLIEQGFDLRASVYDEVICLEPVVGAEQRLELMEKIMCEPPSWAPDIPLRASGYVSTRYMKD